MATRSSMLSAAALLVLACAGCVHARAKAPSATPPLDVPAPPPRVVETAEAAAPPPLGAIQEPERTIPPGSTIPAATPRETTKPEASKADVPQVEAPKPADEARPPAAPAATLQTTPAVQETELDARIRSVLTKASQNLNRVDYTRLNENGKSQYESAKRFITLAEEALRARNLVYAATLGDKAADLAGQLAGR